MLRNAVRWQCAFVVVVFFASMSWGESYRSIRIVTGAKATEVEQNVARVLADRLSGLATVAIQSVVEGEEHGDADVTVLLGTPARHRALTQLLQERGPTLPDTRDPGPEGFLLSAARSAEGLTVAAAGVDERGVLYAVGELLRRTVTRGDSVELPDSFQVRTAPAFRWRGTEVGQAATVVELTGVEPWTEERWCRVALDYALAGANILNSGTQERYDWLRSLGLMTHGGYLPNNLPGHPEWNAVEPIGRQNYVCLSVPEARALVLEGIDAAARNSLPYEVVRIASGDPGGCWCERCAPWGKTYIEMAEDIAAIVHKYHPNAKVYATNQELSNAGDRAIFDHFASRPDSHLAGLFYGPGCNAMSWNGTKRPDHRLDLFEYPAFGVFDRYLREMIQELPRGKELMHFTDITHWFSSQYGFLASWPMPDMVGEVPPPLDFWVYNLQPDAALVKVYNRRTFYARPRAYHRIFRETMRYSEGDITYSEGHHDQFNQWMWQRLLWSPHRSVEDIVDEYCRVHFGPEAAPQMAEAIVQLEENLTAPLETNDGIDRYYELVKQAGEKMPAHRMKTDYLWRQHMQKACLDRYVRLRLRRQTELRKEIEGLFQAALDSGDYDGAISEALKRLETPAESDEMKALRAEAGRLGEESGTIFGVRSEGFFNLDQDLAGLGWTRRIVAQAAEANGQRKKELVWLVARYEDPGEGGFYDDAGDPERSPRMTKGWPYSANNWLAGNLSNDTLPSQRTMAYTGHDTRGVTFTYTGLDTSARYRVRFAFVRPRFLPRYASLHPEKTQSVYADGHLLAKDVEVPEWEVELFEYPIPAEATADGRVEVWLEKSPDVANGSQPEIMQWERTAGWGTLLSDVWLIREPTVSPQP